MTSQPPFPPPALPPPPPGGSPPPNAGSPRLPRPPAPPRPPMRPHRRSIFSGLLLIVVGALLLIARLYPAVRLGFIITHFWPVIFILWGVAKLFDRYAYPQDAAQRPLITGGEAALIIVLVMLVSFVAIGRFVGGRFPRGRIDLPPFTERYTQTRHVDVRTVQANSNFSVTTQNGALTVHGGGDNGLQVLGTLTAPGANQQSADDRMKNLDVVLDGPAGAYSIHPINVNGGDISVDLDVQLPRAAKVVARSQRGDVTVSQLQGGADVATRNGSLQIHDVNQNVSADMQNGDAHISGINGAVNLTGRGGGNVEISDIQGSVSIGGNVFGDVEIRNASKSVTFSSPRCSVQVAALSGQMKIDNSDIVVSHASGPITINARNQDLRLDDVQGQISLSETHGDIYVTFTAPPQAPIDITNYSGDVTLNLPPKSAFTISAQSNSGNVTDDFAANPQHTDDHAPHHDDATYGSGGPLIHLTTKYGDIHIGNSQ